MRLRITSQPAAEPITLAEAKAHLKVEHSDDDTLIAIYIQAAREYAEHFQRRSYITRTYALSVDSFPAPGQAIELPNGPLGSVSGITYVDADGATQTLSTSVYQVINSSEHDNAEIRLAYNQTWPTIRPQADAITITYTAGYGAASTSVKAKPRQAMLLLIAHMYENREAVVVGSPAAALPMAVESLLWTDRIMTIPK